MSRRYFVFPVLLALAAMPTFASEADGDVSALRESIARMTPRVSLAELFARLNNDGVSTETEDGVSVTAQSMEVVVVRLGADGKPVTACVDNLDAAERFLRTPANQLRRGKGSDQ
jgi:hypothetical protein